MVLDVLHSVPAESVDLVFVAFQIGLSQFSGVVCIVAQEEQLVEIVLLALDSPLHIAELLVVRYFLLLQPFENDFVGLFDAYGLVKLDHGLVQAVLENTNLLQRVVCDRTLLLRHCGLGAALLTLIGDVCHFLLLPLEFRELVLDPAEVISLFLGFVFEVIKLAPPDRQISIARGALQGIFGPLLGRKHLEHFLHVLVFFLIFGDLLLVLLPQCLGLLVVIFSFLIEKGILPPHLFQVLRIAGRLESFT